MPARRTLSNIIEFGENDRQSDPGPSIHSVANAPDLNTIAAEVKGLPSQTNQVHLFWRKMQPLLYLGKHILSTKENIWSNDYIDLTKLLHTDPSDEDGQIEVNLDLNKRKLVCIVFFFFFTKETHVSALLCFCNGMERT